MSTDNRLGITVFDAYEEGDTKGERRFGAPGTPTPEVEAEALVKKIFEEFSHVVKGLRPAHTVLLCKALDVEDEEDEDTVGDDEDDEEDMDEGNSEAAADSEDEE